MQPEVLTFWERLNAHGEHAAVSDGATTLSYRQLREQVQTRIQVLDQCQAQRVALALDNGIDWVVWDLALMASGRVCVPVPGFFSVSQQAHVLESAGIDTLVGHSPAAQSLGFSAMGTGVLQRPIAHAPALPAGTIKITYTSGTTGQPKGVCLDGATQLAVAQSLWQAIASSQVQRHLCILPLSTLLENIAGVYAQLWGGSCIEVPSLQATGLMGASGLDLPRMLQCLHETQPHSLILLPQLLHALVSVAEQGRSVPASFRFVAVGGARVAPQLLERAHRLGWPVFEGYGLSECASVVCLNTPKQQRLGTVGTPLPHLELRLADDGEVMVRGPRMLGYVGETCPTPEWLGTGDLGHFEDGYLVLHGRKKHQFITAYGRNVNPEWVESELVQQDGIAQAWLYGEAMAQNWAVIVSRSESVSDEMLDQAIERVNAQLPDYARAHRWVRATESFTQANGLATANGRLRRPALAQRYASLFESSSALQGAPT